MSDQGYLEAIKLIEKAVQEKAEKLDLSFKQLTHLPSEITQLKDCLRFLDLRNNKLSTLPPEIGELQGLTSLNCTDNEIQELHPKIGQLSCLQRLRLSYNKLEYLPPELGNLVNLTELYLTHNQLECLPPEFGQLFQLERLSIGNNNLQKLPEEFGKLGHLIWLEITSNKLKNLPPEIGKLTRLHEIDFSYNQLTKLPLEIGNLSKLNKLNLTGNKLEYLPPEIGNLINLEILGIYNNKLTKLPSEIGNLIKLKDLNLNYNSLTELTVEIGDLNNLVTISINHNELTDIPAEIINLDKLQKISLKNNKIKNLPSAIIQLVRYSKLIYLDIEENPISLPSRILQQKDDPTTIVDFYENRAKNTLKEAKVLLVGQGSVGKTSLIRKLTSDEFNTAQQKTDGIEIRPWYPQGEDTNISFQLQSEDIKINIWDFGGQEIFHATHQFFLTKRSLYLLVLDSRLDERANQLEYWLQIIKSYGKDSPIIIVINKIDEHFLSLDNSGLENKYPNIKGFIHTSCKNGIGIQELKEKIAQEVMKLSHINEEFPKEWLEVKTQLERKKQEHWDYMSYEEYQGICKKQGIISDEEQRNLILFLHDLGVVLNFQDDPRLKDTNILNPVWVTNGVYKILNHKDLENHYKGILYPHVINSILNDDRKYPSSKHSFILDMMCKFELCFELEEDGEKQFLIADLLPKEEPENLKSWEQGLGVEYHYSVLPGSIVSRFIVRMNHLIYEENYWRNGVILKDEQNTALIKADRYANKIWIWISGLKETRRDLLQAIRLQFKQIHQNIPGIEVQEKVVIPDHPSICVDYQHLLDLELMGITNFVPVGLKEKISVKELLEGFISESEKKEIESQEKKIKNSEIKVVNQESSLTNSSAKTKFLVANSWSLYLILGAISCGLVIVISQFPNVLPFFIILLLVIILITIGNWVNNRESNTINNIDIESTIKKNYEESSNLQKERFEIEKKQLEQQLESEKKQKELYQKLVQKDRINDVDQDS